jgi:hypothetical protein
VRNTSVWQRLLGLTRTVVEAVEIDEVAGTIVVSVRPSKGAARRCGHCGRRAGLYDRGQGRRRWRALDVGELRCVLEAEAPRVWADGDTGALGPPRGRGTPEPSTTPSPGWPCSVPRAPSPS